MFSIMKSVAALYHVLYMSCHARLSYEVDIETSYNQLVSLLQKHGSQRKQQAEKTEFLHHALAAPSLCPSPFPSPDTFFGLPCIHFNHDLKRLKPAIFREKDLFQQGNLCNENAREQSVSNQSYLKQQIAIRLQRSFHPRISGGKVCYSYLC